MKKRVASQLQPCAIATAMIVIAAMFFGGEAAAVDIYVTGDTNNGPSGKIWYQDLGGMTRHNADGSKDEDQSISQYIADGNNIIIIYPAKSTDQTRGAFSTGFAGGEFTLTNESKYTQTIKPLLTVPNPTARLFVVTGGTGTTLNLDGTDGALIFSGYSHATDSGGTIRNNVGQQISINGNVTFEGNKSFAAGGVIYSAIAGGKVTLGEYAAGSGASGVMTFKNNTAALDAAAIDARYGLEINIKTVFDGNSYTSNVNGRRGGIIDARETASGSGTSTNSLVVTKDFTFKNNTGVDTYATSPASYALLYTQYGAVFSGSSNLFESNTTTAVPIVWIGGGNVALTSGNVTFSSGNANLSQTSFIGNTIKPAGSGNGSNRSGLLLDARGFLTTDHLTVTGNTAAGDNTNSKNALIFSNSGATFNGDVKFGTNKVTEGYAMFINGSSGSSIEFKKALSFENNTITGAGAVTAGGIARFGTGMSVTVTGLLSLNGNIVSNTANVAHGFRVDGAAVFNGGIVANGNTINAGGGTASLLFVNNGDLRINGSALFQNNRSNSVANDIITTGGNSFFNVTSNQKMSFDGGIWLRKNAAGTAGGSLSIFSTPVVGERLGRVEFVGSEGWSYVAAKTYVTSATFHLGKDALWGKDGSSRANAIASAGLGTYYVGPLYAPSGSGTQQFLAPVTLSYGMGTSSNSNLGGCNAVIFADRIVIAKDTVYNGTNMYGVVNGDDVLISTSAVTARTLNGTGEHQFRLVRDSDGVTLSTPDDSWWRTNHRYDLLHANAFDETNNTGGLFIETGIDRGYGSKAIKHNDSVVMWEFGPYFIREFTYGRAGETGNVDASGDNIYGVELFAREDILGDAPYYDPSLQNRTLASRMNRLSRPYIRGSEYSPYFMSPEDRRWNAWAEVFGTRGGIGRSNDKAGFDHRVGGILVGVENECAYRLTLGCYYGYGDARTSRDSSRWDGGEHTFGGYARLTHHFGYTTLIGNLGFNQYKINRTIGVDRDTYRGNDNAFTGGAYVERGFDWYVNKRRTTKLTPFVALQYTGLYSNGYEESKTSGPGDDMSLKIENMEYSSLRTVLGLRHQTLLQKRLIWNNSFQWEHELSKRAGIVRSGHLVNFDSIRVSEESNYGGFNWCAFGTGLDWAATKQLSFDAGYDIYFSSKATLHTGTAGAKYRF